MENKNVGNGEQPENVQDSPSVQEENAVNQPETAEQQTVQATGEQPEPEKEPEAAQDQPDAAEKDSEAFEKEPEAAAQEQPQAPEKQSSASKIVMAIAVMAAVVALLAVLVRQGYQPVADQSADEPTLAETAVQTEPTETEPPTVPADGNPDDVTCKGTYTASDEAVTAARDTVVATAGDRQLTLSQLQVFYWMNVRNFLMQNSYYLSYFGLNYQQSLDTQVCGLMETPMTWQQFFLDAALETWESYSAMAAEGQLNGFEITEEQKTSLAGIAQELETAAAENGYESAAAIVHEDFGAAAEVEDYVNFLELFYQANGYYELIAGGIQPTDEELAAYFYEHAAGYSDAGVTKDSLYVNVRHILIFPEGADSATASTEEFSEEAWAAAEANAQAILDEWLAGDKTEDSFAALANEHSQDPGSNTNGGLYENVTEGEMVEAFNDWCFDPSRQVGDTGIVKTNYGYHVMFFSGSRPQWIEHARKDYVNENAGNKVEEIGEKFPMTVHYGDILLADAKLA